ncbi:MAG: phenylalanine--tRNA ligase subunit beta [Candidatus Methanophagaceae archaeon]|nr:MAG: phenylalanine--tRNA ligase subunit beta [Methanophagales archaeon]
MPVIKLFYEDLENLTGVSIERIKERLPLLCADVEREEAEYLDVEFFPNRPDLFSVEGVSRALRQFLEVEPGQAGGSYEGEKLEKSGIEMVVEPSVLEVRPYLACGVVRGLRLDSSAIESLMLLQEHLHRGLGRNRAKVSVGVHDLARVKPPFRYLAADPSFSFVPLDYEEEMTLQEILERHPKGVAFRYILEGKEKYPLILDSSEGEGRTLSFPPIINAERTRVTEATEDIFVEVTGLNENVSVALNIIACALAERGGQIQSVVLRYPNEKEKETPCLEPKTVEVSVEAVRSLLGLDLTAEECKRCCERMGLGAVVKSGGAGEGAGERAGERAGEGAGGGMLEVKIPAYRFDILHPWDVIEDIAIGYGYDRLKPELPRTAGTGEVHPTEEKKRAVREIMTGLGFFEVLTFTLTSERKQFELTRQTFREFEVVKVASPLSAEHTMLRCSILPNLLEILSLNTHRDLPQRIFEVGPVVVRNFKEELRLAAVSTHAAANFAEVKSVVDAVLKEMGLTGSGVGGGGAEEAEAEVEVKVVPSENGAFLGGRRAEIILEGKKVGVFGELHPEVILNFGLSQPVVGFEVLLRQ